ncbi:hypothetical protein F5Y15DRAFT_367796 [Xylariaceae sp. FL0016]|nr:hypothetical protein F5Y15DRAFT_367796 [Xylariaceae sp. FL0016]
MKKIHGLGILRFCAVWLSRLDSSNPIYWSRCTTSTEKGGTCKTFCIICRITGSDLSKVISKISIPLIHDHRRAGSRRAQKFAVIRICSRFSNPLFSYSSQFS